MAYKAKEERWKYYNSRSGQWIDLPEGVNKTLVEHFSSQHPQKPCKFSLGDSDYSVTLNSEKAINLLDPRKWLSIRRPGISSNKADNKVSSPTTKQSSHAPLDRWNPPGRPEPVGRRPSPKQQRPALADQSASWQRYSSPTKYSYGHYSDYCDDYGKTRYGQSSITPSHQNTHGYTTWEPSYSPSSGRPHYGNGLTYKPSGSPYEYEDTPNGSSLTRPPKPAASYLNATQGYNESYNYYPEETIYYHQSPQHQYTPPQQQAISHHQTPPQHQQIPPQHYQTISQHQQTHSQTLQHQTTPLHQQTHQVSQQQTPPQYVSNPTAQQNISPQVHPQQGQPPQTIVQPTSRPNTSNNPLIQSHSDLSTRITPRQFAERSEKAIPALVRMISGCNDDQTSADVGSAATFNVSSNWASAGAGGACTNALLAVLGVNNNMSWVQVLEGMRVLLAKKGFKQIPQLSSSRQINLADPFSVTNLGTGKKRALLVGINYTGQQAQLKGCINDALSMKKYLQSKGFTEFQFLADDSSVSQILPTQRNILEGIQWLVNGAKEGDSLFFHYSGHGSQTADTSGDESDHKDETIIPLDYKTAGVITDDTIFEKLVLPVPKGVLMTVLMDCCHSGSVLDLPYVFKANEQNTQPAFPNGNYVPVNIPMQQNWYFNFDKIFQMLNSLFTGDWGKLAHQVVSTWFGR